MVDLRQRLREFGGGLHQQVDDAFSTFSLASGQGYRQFLLAHAAALFSLELALEQAGIEELLEDWPARRRSAALRADLLALGCPLPAALALEVQTSPGWCWGAAYVLEGSRLGAQLLARRVQAAQPQAPMSYLGHAAEHGLWPGFFRQLQAKAVGVEEAQLQQGVEAAFGLFLRAAQQQESIEQAETPGQAHDMPLIACR